ncbi:MAG: alkaline phosphatase family protein [Patescibacteria group bacterium]|nr:alkaline phosphatase family protein [Patescibacteria group bacterium]
MKNDFKIPDYSGMCIVGIPGMIAASFGVTHDRVLPVVPPGNELGRPKKILFVVDSMGKRTIEDNFDRVTDLKSLRWAGIGYDLDSVLFSTTPVAMASIHTGRTPHETAAAEFIQYWEDLGQAMNPILFSKAGQNRDSLLETHLRIDDIYPYEPIYVQLKEHGVNCHQIVPKAYIGSQFNTRMGLGTTMIGYESQQEIVEQAAAILNTTGDPTYVVVYLPEVDDAGHVYGPDSAERTGAVAMAMRTITDFIRKLSPEACRDTTVMITADHDQVPINPQGIFYLDDHVLYRNALKVGRNGPILPTGAPDSLILHIDPNQIDKVLDSLTEHLQDHACVMRTEDALDQGLFGIGERHPKAKSVRGDIVVIGYQEGKHVFWRFGGKDFTQKGIHGGASKRAVEVELMIIEADRF